jgi:hypothetical protein
VHFELNPQQHELVTADEVGMPIAARPAHKAIGGCGGLRTAATAADAYRGLFDFKL